MPEMDGFEVLAYINKHQWNDTFAVIMISADDSPANIKRAYDLGAFDYISRPFDSTIVQRRISNTMFLYARQQRLEKIIAEQDVYKRQVHARECHDADRRRASHRHQRPAPGHHSERRQLLPAHRPPE